MIVTSIRGAQEGAAHARLVVQRNDGRVRWTVWRARLGEDFEYPTAPGIWSADNRSFYFIPETYLVGGCGGECERLYSDRSGGTFLQVNVLTGRVRHAIQNAEDFTVSPNHTYAAYFRARQLIVHNLVDQKQRSFDLPILKDLPVKRGDENPVVGGLVWSPDQTQLAFTVLYNPCSITTETVHTTMVMVDVTNGHQHLLSGTAGANAASMQIRDWTSGLGLIASTGWRGAEDFFFFRYDADNNQWEAM